MFGKKKKEENVNNEFGDKGYIMKDSFEADNLVIAKLSRISNKITSCGSPRIETTKNLYTFELLNIDGKPKYREIFTGFIAGDDPKYFLLPYVVEPIPFTDFFPETIGSKVPKLSLIWAQNDINYSENKITRSKVKEIKP